MKKNLNKAEEDNMNEMDEKIKKALQEMSWLTLTKTPTLMSLSFRNILMRLCEKKDRNQEEFVDIIKGIFSNKNGEVS